MYAAADQYLICACRGGNDSSSESAGIDGAASKETSRVQAAACAAAFDQSCQICKRAVGVGQRPFARGHQARICVDAKGFRRVRVLTNGGAIFDHTSICRARILVIAHDRLHLACAVSNGRIAHSGIAQIARVANNRRSNAIAAQWLSLLSDRLEQR